MKQGYRVALTQSFKRLESLQEMLEQRGYEVIRQPLIETKPLLDEKTRLEAEKLLQCAWILFTSRTAVEAWGRLGKGFKPLVEGEAHIGAVGLKTAEDLKNLGVDVELIANLQNADNFAEMFLKHPKAASPIGLPQGDRALDTLQTKLKEHGFDVWPTVIYKTILHPQSFHDVDLMVLTSPSGVEALQDIGQAKLVAIGETTHRAIQAKGWQAFLATPDGATVMDCIELALKGN